MTRLKHSSTRLDSEFGLYIFELEVHLEADISWINECHGGIIHRSRVQYVNERLSVLSFFYILLVAGRAARLPYDTDRLALDVDINIAIHPGLPQVSVGLIGNEEKRAFTALLGITAGGARLPIQCVYEGKTLRNTPAASAPNRKDCDDADFHFIFSGKPGNHWSNQKTMREWIVLVVIPFLERERVRLGLHPHQKALLIIDVWSVHRSAEFLDWMRENHPDIIIDFHAVKVAYHAWLVETLIAQQDAGEDLDIDTTIGVLRDANVGWIWQGFCAIESKELILKAWSKCEIRGGLNLSYECMTSFETNERLTGLRNENPTLWNDLSTKSTRDYCPGDDDEVVEDTEQHDDEEEMPLESGCRCVERGNIPDEILGLRSRFFLLPPSGTA
ncbi:hypothetical protein B0H14DRAFT_3756934 [Mycena olivaceomarginata]|nr:hypothetical protein B0H14DRAFT_3756934 [Mycena olivaceomarginata]